MKKVQNKGYSQVRTLAAVLIIGVLIFAGWLIYYKTQSKTPALPNTASWKTYRAVYDGLSFKHPPGWTEQRTGCVNPVTHNGAECGLVISPVNKSTQERFVITYSYNIATSAGRGPSHIIEASNLDLRDRKKPLQLVVLSKDTKDKNSVGGLYVVDAKSYKSGTDVSDIQTAFSSQKIEGYFVVMSASLVSKSQNISLKQYKANPDYQNVVGIFNSISYK